MVPSNEGTKVPPKVRRSHQRTFHNGPWPWFLLSDDMLKLSISVESQNRIGVSDNTCARAVKMEVNLKLDLAGFGRSINICITQLHIIS